MQTTAVHALSRTTFVCLLVSLTVVGLPARAGVSLNINQIASLSGTNGADLGQGLRTGAEVVFKDINDRGGIHGRQIRFKALDDVYDPARTVALTRESVAKDDPIALINYRGTANTAALIESGVLEAAGIPLVGTLTGATSVHKSAMIFHTRTSYADEVRKLIQALATIGHKRIALVHSADAFGQSGLQAADEAATALQVQLERTSFQQKGEGSKASIESAAATAADGLQSAAVLVAVGEPALQLMDEMRTKSPGLPIYALSVVAPEAVVSKLGIERARGIGFSQVFPSPYTPHSRLSASYIALMKKYAPNESLGYFSLEGFVNAKVTVEALRRCGADCTRAKLLSTLRSMGRISIEDMRLDFSRTGQSASAYTDLTVLGSGGRLMR